MPDPIFLKADLVRALNSEHLLQRAISCEQTFSNFLRLIWRY